MQTSGAASSNPGLPGVLDGCKSHQYFIVCYKLVITRLCSLCAAYYSHLLYHVTEQSLSSPVLGVPVTDRTPEREDIIVAEKAGHATVSVSWEDKFIFSATNELLFIFRNCMR